MTRAADTDDDWAREIARLLLRRVGYAAAAQVLEEEAGENGPTPSPRRRRTIGHGEALRRARELLPPDDLTRARAKRGR